MSWKPDPEPLNRVFRAPLDVSGGSGLSPNRSSSIPVGHVSYGRSEAASEASLGNLRNSRAAGAAGEGANPGKEKGKPDSQKGAKTTREEREFDRFELQRTSAALLPDMRVAHCIWTATGHFVDLIKRGADARFGGVQTCGSWSSCPVCSARIAEVRRQELRLLEEWAGSQGLRLVMMTLTARHRRRALRSMVDRLAKARNRMHGRKVYQRLRAGPIVGTVAVREVTHGQKHGWHPHYHVLYLVQADTDEEALALLEPLRNQWLDCLRKEGLTGTTDRAFHLQSGDAVSAYLSKHGRDEGDRVRAEEKRSGWGISEEMTQSRFKRGRGKGEDQSRSPAQILRDASAGDEASGTLWQEYCRVMYRRPQMVWSDGLKDLVGLRELEDEEVAEGEEFTEEEDQLLHTFDRSSWRYWRRYRAQLLAAARKGPEAVEELLRQGPQEDQDPDLIEPEEPHRPPEREAQRDADMVEFLELVEQLYQPVPGGLAAQALAAIPPPPS
jgi:hypothetical protein